jgi:hypothetical protein
MAEGQQGEKVEVAEQCRPRPCADETEKRRWVSSSWGKRREWMGVEPTVACSAQPTTGFEDRAHHRARTTPAWPQSYHIRAGFQSSSPTFQGACKVTSRAAIAISVILSAAKDLSRQPRRFLAPAGLGMTCGCFSTCHRPCPTLRRARP